MTVSELCKAIGTYRLRGDERVVVTVAGRHLVPRFAAREMLVDEGGAAYMAFNITAYDEVGAMGKPAPHRKRKRAGA